MEQLSNAQTGDDYTTAATIADVWRSSGGFAVVSIADAYVQLEYGDLGQTFWTDEVHIPANSPLALEANTVGIRFRSFSPGVPATINAALAAEAEPPITLTSPGTVTVAAGKINGVTGLVSAAGAVVAGTGFSVVRNSAGDYTVTFSPVLSATPDLIIKIADPINGVGFENYRSWSSSGFHIVTVDTATNPSDRAFNFIAIVPQ